MVISTVKLWRRFKPLVLFLLYIDVGGSVSADPDFSPNNASCASRNFKYNETTGKCQIPVLSMCREFDTKDYSCEPNSECNYHYRYNHGRCVCSPHFAPFEDPHLNTITCELKRRLGEPCKPQTTEESLVQNCDDNSRLICLVGNESITTDTDSEFPGTCGCDDGDFWNEQAQICIATSCQDRKTSKTFLATEADTAGSCLIKLGIRTNGPWLRENLVQCPPNSRFQLNSNSEYYSPTDLNEGTCECHPNFLKTSDDKQCIPIKSYHESCIVELGDPCDPVIGLTCRNDICECGENAVWNHHDSLCYSDNDCNRRLPGTFYDTETQTCIAALGAKCVSASRNPKNVTLISCPKNSFCSNWNICKCNKELFNVGDNRNCVKATSFDEPCKIGEDICNPRNHLICLNGTCGCEGKSGWDVQNNVCRALAGGACGDSGGGKECTREAWCFAHNRFNYDFKKTCACNGGHTETREGLCLANYLQRCEMTDHCMPGTICIDQTCKCRNPTREVFDQSRTRCVGLVGSECSSNGTKCVATSTCLNGICQCENGYLETLTRSCSKYLEHGAECFKSETQCDFNQGLACIEGTCVCLDSYLKFVPGTGCVAAAGSPCGSVEPVRQCQATGWSNGEPSIKNGCQFYNVQCDSGLYCNHHVGNGFTRCDITSSVSEGTAKTVEV